MRQGAERWYLRRRIPGTIRQAAGVVGVTSDVVPSPMSAGASVARGGRCANTRACSGGVPYRTRSFSDHLRDWAHGCTHDGAPGAAGGYSGRRSRRGLPGHGAVAQL